MCGSEYLYIISHLCAILLVYMCADLSGGKIFMDMENFAGLWKKFRGYVYACTNEPGLLHLW